MYSFVQQLSSDVKDASDNKILIDMLLWAIDNPSPANVLLVSGDRDFSGALQQVRLRKYIILLAQPTALSPALAAKANHGIGPILLVENMVYHSRTTLQNQVILWQNTCGLELTF